MVDDLGDFQTPPELIAEVLRSPELAQRPWDRAFEPTCGRGNFVRGLLQLRQPPREIWAVELQDRYIAAAREIARQSAAAQVTIEKGNIFQFDLERDIRWHADGPLLVIGNPPWVTNSELSAASSSNLPRKANVKGLRGIDALTGESNFDIAEYIWLKLLTGLADEHPTIALLCKTTVARNVLKFAHDRKMPVIRSWLRRVDAKQWFGATVDACLFGVELGVGATAYECAVFPDLGSATPTSKMGLVNGNLVADVQRHTGAIAIDGTSTLTWRQGVKHDGSAVAELQCDSDGTFRNKAGQVVDVERQYIFPLMKSSDVFNGTGGRHRRAVIVTQRRVGQDTKHLQVCAPQLWDYLVANAEVFDRRKSRIYLNMPRFAMFGVGDYSFSLYKVAVAGMYKTPRFRAVGPADGKPVMLDDTCYFVPCDDAWQAALIAALLNDPRCLQVMETMVFADSKRPITKKLLQRIDLRAVLAQVNRHALLARADDQFHELGERPTARPTTWSSALDELLTILGDHNLQQQQLDMGI